MKLKLKLILVFLLIGIFFFSCSKEDSETSENSQNGGEISRFQIVTVDVGSTILNNNTYAGTLNNLPIQLAKIDDNKLVFYVTETTPLGKARLVVPEINNLKITYDVIDVALSQTAQLTLQPLVEYEQTYFNTITSTPENVPFIQNHNSFMTFLNNLNSDDIDKAAKFYKVNKNIIDPIYTTDYNLIQGRNSVAVNNLDFVYYKSLINKHKAAVAITIIAGVIATVPPYEPVETTIAIGVACAGIYKSKEFHGEILTDVFRVIEINLGGVNGINNRFNNSTNSNLTFTDGQISILPFQVNAKNFKNSDSSIQKQYLQLFFEAKSKLNYFISGINTTIDWVNDNVPLVNFSSIPLTSVPNNSGGSSFDANSQIMQGFSFSLNHPNLSLQSASLTSTGQLSVKIKIIGNPTTVPVTSTLNYSYNDDFSTFSGNFPISVEADTSDFLVGTWDLVSANGIPANQLQVLNTCPSEPTEDDYRSGFTLYGDAVFTLTSFDCNMGRSQYVEYCITNECTGVGLCYSNANHSPHIGTYQSEGNYVYTVLTNTGGTINTTITVIDQNNITVTQGGLQKRYVRQ